MTTPKRHANRQQSTQERRYGAGMGVDSPQNDLAGGKAEIRGVEA